MVYIKEYAEKFYKSKEWTECREAYIKSLPSKLCQRCHQNPGKIVHHKKHITPFNINDPMITLNFNNLEYVCQDCHNKEHMCIGAIREGLKFDEEGNIIEEKSPPGKN